MDNQCRTSAAQLDRVITVLPILVHIHWRGHCSKTPLFEVKHDKSTLSTPSERATSLGNMNARSIVAALFCFGIGVAQQPPAGPAADSVPASASADSKSVVECESITVKPHRLPPIEV